MYTNEYSNSSKSPNYGQHNEYILSLKRKDLTYQLKTELFLAKLCKSVTESFYNSMITLNLCYYYL